MQKQEGKISADMMRQLTDQLEQGVRDVFAGEMYQNYLKTMSRFHRYSVNNSLLITMQKPEATLIAGYRTWQNRFHRQVKKGEQGIRIIAPIMIRQKEENGEDRKTEKRIPVFRPVTVFDISQTEGEPLPAPPVQELDAKVHGYPAFFAALREVSPVPIRFADLPGDVHGLYHIGRREILLQTGMEEAQTVKTAVHEIAHACLHGEEEGADRRTREIEAESVAYVVCRRYGIDTSSYSFGYLALWSSDRNTRELRASLEQIRSASSDLICQIGESLERRREREPEIRKKKEGPER